MFSALPAVDRFPGQYGQLMARLEGNVGPLDSMSQATMNNETNSQVLQARSKHVYSLYQTLPWRVRFPCIALL